TDFPYNGFISLSTVPVSFLKGGIVLDKWGEGDFPWTSGAFVKLKKDAVPAHIAARMTSIYNQRAHLHPDTKISFALQPLSDVHFNQEVWDGFPKGHAETQYILAGIGIFILLLGVINFINLSTALSIRRAKEVGIRKVLGGSRNSLTIQFLIETGILTLFSLLLAALLVNPVLHLFHTMIPARLHIRILSPGMLLFLAVIAVATTLLSGLYPARVLASWLPVLCLKGNGAPTGGEKWWLRKGLIVFQFTISLTFIISTMIIGRQINYMSSEGLGFSTDAIITLDTQRDDTTRRVKVLAEKLAQVPGIRMIARQSFSPITDFHTMLPIQYKGRQVVNISSALQIADKNFIPLYKMELLAGENLRPTDSLKELVINEAMVRAMGLTHPREAVGQFLSLGDTKLPIIGVVADYHEYSYHYNILPVSMADLPGGEPSIAIKLATSGKSIDHFQKTIARIEKEWKSIYPEAPFKYSFLDDAIQRMYEKEKETAFLLSAAMIITIFISCMGLFGLSMFTARQRTKEVGIRKVLGASVASISLLLSRNVIALVALATIIAAPIAWYGTQLWLRNFAYRASISPWIFVVSGLAALMIALLTISFQTIKTAMANPTEALRVE
ncbi:MAG TPA: FtsX-like permease family protein, partial [Puia sp.]